MIQRCLILTILVIGLLTTACQPSEFQDNHGNNGRYADFQGRWLVINYWAVWCKPCIEEIPELNKFAAAHREQVALLGVDFDQATGAKLQQGVDKLGIEFPVLITDPAPVLGFDKPTVLPTTLIFNPQGKLHKILKGPQTQATLQKIIDS